MVTIPLESVTFRRDAVPTRGVVVVLEETATKKNLKAETATSGSTGLDLETVLSLRVLAPHGPEPRFVWCDVHVFDAGDQLVRSQTVGLQRLGPAEDGEGDVFGFEGSVYRGTGASPGSVWLAPDARKVQYRLYYEAGGTVYSDGLLRQHDLPADSELTRSAEPASRRRRDGRRPAGASRPDVGSG